MWLTSEEAARHLRMSLRQIRRLTRAQTIPFHRVGKRLLFHRDELDAWVRDEAA